MGKKSKSKGKPSSALEPAGAHMNKGTLAECLNQTSQIAAECNTILRDLMRGRSPQHEDLQRLASQVLMGQTVNLEELHQKMESQQATLAELLTTMKPNGVDGSGSGFVPASGMGLEVGPGGVSYDLPEPSLSVIKGWDSSSSSFNTRNYGYSDVSATAGAAAAAAAARRRRGNQVKGSSRNGGNISGGTHNSSKNSALLSKRERYLAVEQYWRSMPPKERKTILSAPVKKVLEVATAEGGSEAAKEVADGLMLLKNNGSRHACFWRCPCCNLRTNDPRAFLFHMAGYHEGVQYSAEETPLLCSSCGNEVVGAYFYQGDADNPTETECFTCAWDDHHQAGKGQHSALLATNSFFQEGWSLFVPQPTEMVEGRTWADDGSSLASTEAMTASSGGDSEDDDGDGDDDDDDYSGEEKGEGDSDEEEGEESTCGSDHGKRSDSTASESEAEQAHNKLFHPSEAENSALESRIQNGADGLLKAIAHRLQTLSQYTEFRSQFQMALARIVHRAQQIMHGDTSTPDAEESAYGSTPLAATEGKNKRQVLTDLLEIMSLPTPPGPNGSIITTEEDEENAAVLKHGLDLLTPSELQDLLALMARKYSPHARHHGHGHGDGGHYGGTVPKKYEASASYEPMCWSLFRYISYDTTNTVSLSNKETSTTAVVASTPTTITANDAEEGASQQQNSISSSQLQPPPGPGSDFHDLVEINADTDMIIAQPWWSDHLSQKTFHDLGSTDDIYLLRWIYGSMAYGPTDEFLERQRLSCRAKTSGDAIVDAFGEIAEMWRHLGATMDKKRHITTLLDAVAEDVDAVSTFDSSQISALRAQANAFFEEVANDPALAAAAAAKNSVDSNNKNNSTRGVAEAAWSQLALAKLQRYHELKDESSIRYAQALIDREIAVLELAEVMDQHELDSAEGELMAVDSALAAAGRDLAEAEVDLGRAQAEGPALHRKRDLLDRVNKEAEHRERLQELQQHIASCKERIVNEEEFGASAHGRREEAASDLDDDRTELQGYLERRQALDRACHDVLAAQERDKGHELTDAYVDARIKAVWQVVAGVADAIKGLHDRYEPGSKSREANRYGRCTSLAKDLTTDLDERIRGLWVELDKLRCRAADLACVDAGQIVEAATLEVIRQELEERAAAAREAAIVDLLQELEAEEEAKKAAESKKAKKKASKAGKKNKAGDGDKAASDANGSSIVQEKKSINGGSDTAPTTTTTAATAEQSVNSVDPDVEYEAALERRRQELEKQEQDRLRQEAELIRLAQEASLAAENAAAATAAALHAGKSVTSTASSGSKGGSPSVLTVPRAGSAASAGAGSPGSASHSGGGGGGGDLRAHKTAPRVVLVHRNSPGASGGSPKTLPPPPPPPPPHGIRTTAPSSHLSSGAPPGGAANIPPPPPPNAAKTGEMRVITYFGDWICYCNKTNRLWDTCTCGQIPPCRDWVRGRCTYKDRCRFAHPPFELPDTLPRPKSPIAKPGPDAMVFRKAIVGGNGEGTAAAAAGGVAGGGASNKPGPVLVPVPISATSNRHGVGTPEAQPGSVAPRTEGSVPMAAAAAASDAAAGSAPLKPAPWANVRPGSAVTGPAAPIAAGIAANAASGPSTEATAQPSRPLPPAFAAGGAGTGGSPAGMSSLTAPASFLPSHQQEDGASPATMAPPAEFQYQQQQQLHDYLLGITATSTGSGNLGSPAAAPTASSVFDPFGSSLLVQPQHHQLSSEPSSVGASQLNTAFPSLSLGPSLLQQQELGQQQEQQQQQPQQQQFIGNPSSPPALSPFSRGLSSDGTNVGAAVFQPSAHGGNGGNGGGGGSSGGSGGFGLGASQHHSIDLGASLLPPQSYSPAAGLGTAGSVSGLGISGGAAGSNGGGYGGASPGGLQPSTAAGVGAGEVYDDWGDLQLQLPSDLGEILGDDPPLMMSMPMSSPQPQQQPLHLQQQQQQRQQQQQQGVGMGTLYGSGNTSGGSNGLNGSGLGAPPGWGAF